MVVKGTCPDRSCVKQLRVHHARHHSYLGFPGCTNFGHEPSQSDFTLDGFGSCNLQVFTDGRSFQYPKIVLGEHEIEWKKSIKYLGTALGCSDSAHAPQHWWPRGSQEKAGGERGEFKAALRSSGLDKCP